MQRLLKLGKWADLPMRPGFGSFMHPTEEKLTLIKQLGVDEIILNMYRNNLIDTNFDSLPLPGDHQWEYKDLLMLRNTVENAGIRLLALENMPFSFYDKIMMGQAGREEQLKHVQETISNMGRAGIPVLGYGWTPTGVWRSSTTYRIRGGAQAMSVDLDDFKTAPLSHGRIYSEEEMWDYYQYFLEGVLPVAEEAGVTLALHPNDPPVPSLAGVPQLFRSFEAYKKAMEMVKSENHGLQYCLGNFSEMGADIDEVTEYFGKQDKLVYVHFQTVSNSLSNGSSRFNEVFVDMPGYYDPVKVLRKLKEVGYKGMIMPGHVPKVIGDGSWEERGRAFTIGYIKGIMATLGQED
ncbi:mannonate dehydratase [Pseudozobellia thermophila]|uniref:mannonate dehydratase n=1 Tax=Pseudozobellia thermophila TaxID=192903 RepID=A0A1M6GDR4_9FLAO|nr:mannonate dehydratase [Pseudozobellia thermophila]SHJ08068.1 mannonate dehydratase [Pseudozobellia thermophila]